MSPRESGLLCPQQNVRKEPARGSSLSLLSPPPAEHGRHKQPFPSPSLPKEVSSQSSRCQPCVTEEDRNYSTRCHPACPQPRPRCHRQQRNLWRRNVHTQVTSECSPMDMTSAGLPGHLTGPVVTRQPPPGTQVTTQTQFRWFEPLRRAACNLRSLLRSTGGRARDGHGPPTQGEQYSRWGTTVHVQLVPRPSCGQDIRASRLADTSRGAGKPGS